MKRLLSSQNIKWNNSRSMASSSCINPVVLKQVHCSQIKNHDKPICATCKHFQPSWHFTKDLAVEFGKCRYYGEMNILDGKINYTYASIIRNNHCGLDGKNYEHDQYYRWKYINVYLQPFLIISPALLFILYCSQN